MVFLQQKLRESNQFVPSPGFHPTVYCDCLLRRLVQQPKQDGGLTGCYTYPRDGLAIPEHRQELGGI